MFVSLWEFFYGHFFRFWMKWLLRQMTGKCELQRIFDTYVGAQRTHRIENSLTYSKNKVGSYQGDNSSKLNLGILFL
uniref:ELMO domain containing 2 n=1 Tax=Equus caballus TaxID=9796 RepID=A0A9L0SV00_HORSE